jgi:hypothetical protein
MIIELLRSAADPERTDRGSWMFDMLCQGVHAVRGIATPEQASLIRLD